MKHLILSIYLLVSTTCIAQKQFSSQELLHPVQHAETFEKTFIPVEIAHYIPNDSADFILENGYASALLNKPLNHWPKRAIADTIDVVFSLYPKNPEFWLTNYHILLARRLNELFKHYPFLNNERITWRIILQTDCETEPEAMALFHGFVIHFTLEKPNPNVLSLEPITKAQIPAIPKVPPYSLAKNIENFILENGGFSDTAVFTVLKRNSHRWDSALVVIDWTGSMYNHGAQAILFHLLYTENLNISNFVFFNDGNSRNNQRKEAGNAGGIYFLSADKTHLEKSALKTFHKVQRKGDGGDREENDIEALMAAIQASNHYRDIILIADNSSCMRDLFLVNKIKNPIHIILPGNIKQINHQYINLAYRTKGSLHTLTTDILDFQKQIDLQAFEHNGFEYVLNPFGYFQPLNIYSYKFCNAFYGIDRYGLKSREWLNVELDAQSNR